MNRVQEKRIKDRRKSVDFWFYLARVMTFASWFLFLFAIVMSFYAAPEKSYGVARYYDLEIRRFWLTPLTGYLYLVIWGSAAGSYAAQLINKYRNRRNSDNPYYHLYILLIMNLIWLSVIVEHVLSVKKFIN